MFVSTSEVRGTEAKKSQRQKNVCTYMTGTEAKKLLRQKNVVRT